MNEKFAERDHAKLREAIVAWVRETKMRVLLAPEMTYAVPRLKPLLYFRRNLQPHGRQDARDRLKLRAFRPAVTRQKARNNQRKQAAFHIVPHGWARTENGPTL